MENIDSIKLIIACIVILIWLSILGYYLFKIFKDYGKPLAKSAKKIISKEIFGEPYPESIEVNDEEYLSTEHKSFLNVVQNSTFDDEDISLNYESTKFLMRVKYHGRENYILEYSNDDKLYLPINELFDLSDTMNKVWVVQQPILFKHKQEAVDFSNKFMDYDDCENHNKKVNEEYEALLKYRELNPPKPKPKKVIDKTTLIIEK